METTHRLTRHLADQISAQWPNGPSRLLLGVSGGADSICLLHLLESLSCVTGFRLHAMHVHHGIRGEDADTDMKFVSDLCRRLNVPFLFARVDAPAMAGSGKLSLEDAARRLRYKVMSETAEQLGADALVLAHHRDDQAETVLMHLLRGAASEGLCGMHVFRDGLFRPMLACPGSELRACMVENGWEWREDASNRDEAHRRNALRHRWIPLLRGQLGQDPTGPLVRFAAIQQQEQAFLSVLAREAADKAGLTGGCGGPADGAGKESSANAGARFEQSSGAGARFEHSSGAGVRFEQSSGAGVRFEQSSGAGARFEAAALCSLPEVLARRVVFLAWERATGSRNNLETVHAEAILGLCRTGRAGSRLSLPGSMEARLDGEWCSVVPSAKLCDPGDAAEQEMFWQVKLDWPEVPGEIIRVPVPEAAGSLRISLISLEDARTAYGCDLRGKESERGQLIDSSSASTGITLRNRRPGDVIRPWNAPGTRKLKEWFIDKKIPRDERGKIPLLVSGKQILWVIGHRTSVELGGTGKDAFLHELVWIVDS